MNVPFYLWRWSYCQFCPPDERVMSGRTDGVLGNFLLFWGSKPALQRIYATLKSITLSQGLPANKQKMLLKKFQIHVKSQAGLLNEYYRRNGFCWNSGSLTKPSKMHFWAWALHQNFLTDIIRTLWRTECWCFFVYENYSDSIGSPLYCCLLLFWMQL